MGTADLERLRLDDAAWDAFVEGSDTDYPLQLSAWATAKAPYGWSAVRVVADGGSGPIGAQVLVRSLGPGPFALGYAPRGPVATTFDQPSLEAFTAALRRISACSGSSTRPSTGPLRSRSTAAPPSLCRAMSLTGPGVPCRGSRVPSSCRRQ